MADDGSTFSWTVFFRSRDRRRSGYFRIRALDHQEARFAGERLLGPEERLTRIDLTP